MSADTKKIEYAYDRKVAAIHKLRVNIKSLAAEARIIRKEVRRCGPLYREQLTEHRRGRLREEARYAHLALAYLRGRSYRSVEKDGSKPAESQRLLKKLVTTGPDVLARDVEAWLK